MSKDPYHPRRAYRLWWWPRWLQVFTGACVIVLAFSCGLWWAGVANRSAQVMAAPIPNPTPTWTTYVPQMPRECEVMLDRARDLRNRSLDMEDVIVKALQLHNANRFSESRTKLEEADKVADTMSKTHDQFAEAYNECLEA